MSIFIDYYDCILIVFSKEWGLSDLKRWQGWVVGAPDLSLFSHQNFFQGNSSESGDVKEMKIMWICSSSVVALYVSAECPVLVVL